MAWAPITVSGEVREGGRRCGMKVTRRELLRGAGTFVGGFLLNERVMGAGKRKHSRRRVARTTHAGRKTRAVKSERLVDAGTLSGAKLFEDVITYYNFGEHRTASGGDLRTSRWLADQLRATGLEGTFQ